MDEFSIRHGRSGDEALILQLLLELAEYEKLLEKFHRFTLIWGWNGFPSSSTVGMIGLTRSRSTSAVPTSSATLVTILTPVQSPDVRESMKPCRGKEIGDGWRYSGRTPTPSIFPSAASTILHSVEPFSNFTS